MMNSTSKPILDFRTLLKMIYILFRTGEFTSGELSERLRGTTKPIVTLNPYFMRLYQRSNRKLISNDLRRLYAMGFLKRRRVKRECKTKSGKICYRGYEYKYSLSSQAVKYLEYLEKGKKEEELEELADLIVKIMIEKKTPEEARDILWEFYQTQVKEKKGSRRFSTSRRAFWEKVLERTTEVFRDRKIKALEERVKLLKKENEELKKKIEELENKNAMLMKCIKKFLDISPRIDRALERAVELKKENERYKKAVQEDDEALANLLSIEV